MMTDKEGIKRYKYRDSGISFGVRDGGATPAKPATPAQSGKYGVSNSSWTPKQTADFNKNPVRPTAQIDRYNERNQGGGCLFDLTDSGNILTDRFPMTG